MSDDTMAARPKLEILPATNGDATEAFDLALSKAELLANSDLVPKDFKGKPGNVIAAVQMGKEVGLRPMQALQNIAVINGRPCLWGDAVLAVIMQHPDFEYVKEHSSEEMRDKKYGRCELKRKGMEPVVREFTWEDAKRAGLADKAGPWKQYPQRMMQMRARSWAARDTFPDALRGLSVAEEVVGVERSQSGGHPTIEGESFQLKGVEYETAGITKPTFKSVLDLSGLVDKAYGKGHHKKLLHDKFGAESRKDLIEDEGKRFRLELAKLCDGASTQQAEEVARESTEGASDDSE